MYIQPSTSGLVDDHQEIRQAEHFFKKSCESSDEQEQEAVPPGSIRCSFRLVPMVAEYKYFKFKPALVRGLGNLVTRNVWFSQVLVSMDARRERLADARAMKMTVRHLFARLFDSAARSPELPIARSTPEIGIQRTDPLQLGAIQLNWKSWPRIEEFGAMCSALLRAQTTKKLQIYFEDLFSSQTHLAGYNQGFSNKLWKWLAYALFSKRARVGCSVENLSLVSIGSMTTEGVESFVSIVQSDHPEELLFDCPRGVLGEREAMLNSGSFVRWEFNGDGQPVMNSRMLTFESQLAFVRTFSDDGVSNWVDAIIPGLGKCQVQRCDLVFYESSATDDSDSRLESLTIGFHERARVTLDALYDLLLAVGRALKFLEIRAVAAALDVSKILSCCPNLELLSISGEHADTQLLPCDLSSPPESVPCIMVNLDDAAALTNELQNTNGLFTKCLRRLRLRLVEDAHGLREVRHIERALQATLQMLKTNQTLEYLEVVATFRHKSYADAFEKNHLVPINRALRLPQEFKAAFLSVVSPRKAFSCDTKKRKHGVVPNASAVFDLDQLALLKIFEFAAQPVLRRVYFRMIAYINEQGRTVDD